MTTDKVYDRGEGPLAFYNEIDPFAAAWLRELIAAGHIAPGIVDERDIRDVRPSELAGFTQCHFFAGIGVWSYALRRAGWPDDLPIWTASCPCQPFSAAGKGDGFADERHLWPSLDWLIQQCRPQLVLGEQVASKNADTWLDLVQADLEGMDYAFGCAPFPSAGVGAPHIRDRAYWMANRAGERRQRGRAGEADTFALEPERFRDAGRVAHAEHPERRPLRIDGQDGRDGQDGGRPEAHGVAGTCGEVLRLADSLRSRAGDTSEQGVGAQAAADRIDGGVSGQRLRAWIQGASVGMADASIGGQPVVRNALEPRCGGHADGGGVASRPSPTNGFWSDADWLGCTDGKWRPVEPGTFPLAHGAPARVGRLRGYGNAINAEAATVFIEAVIDHLEAPEARTNTTTGHCAPGELGAAL